MIRNTSSKKINEIDENFNSDLSISSTPFPTSLENVFPLSPLSTPYNFTELEPHSQGYNGTTTMRMHALQNFLNFLQYVTLHRDYSTLICLQSVYSSALYFNNNSLSVPCAAYHCAFTSTTAVHTTSLDTDSVYIILDTGATAAFTYCMNDFTSFTPLNSKVKGLGTLRILGIGTIEYKIQNDKGETAILSIAEAFYVPDLKTRLISPQQLCSQYPGTKYQGDDKSFTFSWQHHNKTVAISKTNNLPILHTKAGMKNGIHLFTALMHGNIPNKSILVQKSVPQFCFNVSQ